MDKLTYLAELAEGLARWVPERERQDILRYYAEYFEEAGPEREAQVVQELGDPWALSCRLAVDGGFVTQEQAASWTPKKKRKWPWILAGTVAVLIFIGLSIAKLVLSLGVNVAQRTVDWVFSDDPIAMAEVVEGGDEIWAEEIPGEGPVTYVQGSEGFWSMEDGWLDGFSSIDADISLGNITVTSGEDYTLWVDGTNGNVVDWEIKGGVLKIRDGSAMKNIEVNNWSDFKRIFGVGAMNIAVTVPDGELEKVKLKTDLGDIILSDLSVAVKIEAETSMGNVEGYEVRTAGKIDLESSMGNVTLSVDEPYGGMEIELETSMGNVEAQMGSVESMWDYEAKTSMGNVTVNDVDRGTKVQRKGGDYKLEAKSDMGDVDVYFEDDRW